MRIDIVRSGDCRIPGPIATAVYAGHLYAREMDETAGDGAPFAREGILTSSDVGQELQRRIRFVGVAVGLFQRPQRLSGRQIEN